MVESWAFLKRLRATDTPPFVLVCHNSSVTRHVAIHVVCALLTLPALSFSAAPAADSGRTALDRADLRQLVQTISREHGVDPKLVDALVRVESSYDPNAVSRRGAMGLMQLMPATAKQYGVRNAFDPGENLLAGSRHLRHLLDEFGGDLTLALAAYNAGSGAVRRHGGVPAYRETRDYVRRVHEKLGKSTPDGGESATLTDVASQVKLVRDKNGKFLLVN